MKLEKFDLEKVLNGAKVVTRDGREVTQLTKFEDVGKYPLVGVLEGDVKTWTIKGYYLDGWKELNADLFIEGKVQSVWVNIYKNKYNGEIFIGCDRYKSKEDAINNTYDKFHTTSEYIKTIEITDEV
jgi:hypothetical protein